MKTYRGNFTDEAFGALQEMLRNDVTVTEACRALRISFKTAQRWLGRGVCPSEHRANAGKRKLPKQHLALIRRRLKKLLQLVNEEHTVTRVRYTPLRKIRREHTQTERKYPSITALTAALVRSGFRIGKSQVHRDLKALGLDAFRTPRGPLLKPKQLADRMNFATKLLKMPRKELQNIMFSDEKYFDTHTRRFHSVWCENKDTLKAIKAAGYVQGGPKVMVLGFLGRSVRKLIVCDEETMSAEKYSVYLKRVMPTIQKHWLQQDNASAHTKLMRSSFFRTHNVRTMVWPSSSPDLNVIETVWARLAATVAARAPQDTAGQAELRALHDEFRERLEVCKESGGHIVTRQKLQEWRRQQKKAKATKK